MSNEKEIKNEKNKSKAVVCLVIGIILVIALIAMAIIMFFGGVTPEAKLTKSLKSMGSDFYENFYYEQVGSTKDERATFLSKYETIGIKINLENLSRYDNSKYEKEIKNFVNNKTNKQCNKENTKVEIYPTSPYEKDSYTMEIKLDCGFEK